MKKNKNNESISINKFLRIYYGISDEKLLTQDISHKALKRLIPELKRLSFDYAYKNKDLIASGDIILVNDCNGNMIPYLSPIAVDDIVELDSVSISKEEKQFENICISENLNIYQLSELCKKFKQDRRIKEYRFAYRLLKLKKQKNEKTKKYRMRGYKNDQY